MNDWLDICCDCDITDILHLESHKKMALHLSNYPYIHQDRTIILFDNICWFISYNFCLYLALTLINIYVNVQNLSGQQCAFVLFIPLSKNLRNEVTAYWMKCTLCWNFHPDFIFYMLIWMLLNFCRRCTQNIKIPCFILGILRILTLHVQSCYCS